MKLVADIDSAKKSELALFIKFLGELHALSDETGAAPDAFLTQEGVDAMFKPTPTLEEAAARYHLKVTPAAAEWYANGETKQGDWVTDTGAVPDPEHVVTVDTAPPPLPSAEFDSNGIQWDERIHASTRAKTTKLAWKYRRGVPEAQRLAIEMTLPRVQVAAPTPPPPPPSQPMPIPPPPPAVAPATSTAARSAATAPVRPFTVPAPTPPTVSVPLPPNLPPPSDPDVEFEDEDAPAPVSSAPAAGSTPAAGMTFESFMVTVSGFMAGGQLTTQQLNAKLAEIGVGNLISLATPGTTPEAIYKAAKHLGIV